MSKMVLAASLLIVRMPSTRRRALVALDTIPGGTAFDHGAVRAFGT
jgi:hypothetical protein